MAGPHSRVFEINEQQQCELERLYYECPRPTPAHIRNFIAYRSVLASLDSEFLSAWFAARRLKEKRDGYLSSLIHENENLKIEHQTLLFRNKELRDQTILLNLENRQLKKKLEMQLQKRQSSASSIVTGGDFDSFGNEEPSACSFRTEFGDTIQVQSDIIQSSDDSCSSA